MELDQAAIKEIAKTAPVGTSITLIVDKTKDIESAMHFELKIVTDAGIVKDFNGGKAIVKINLNKALNAIEKLIAVYIDDNGKYHKIGGEKNTDGTYSFTTAHFSEYAVMSEEEADKILKQQDEEYNAYLEKGVKNTTIKLTSTLGKGFIKLNWKKSLGYKVDYYEVYKSTKRYSGYGTEPYYETKQGGLTGTRTPRN